MDWTKMATVGKAVTPWATLAGGLLGGVGAGTTAYQQGEREEKMDKERAAMFDWQKKQDDRSQFNTERQLGQNTLQSMRGSFKDAVYRALTRG